MASRSTPDVVKSPVDKSVHLVVLISAATKRKLRQRLLDQDEASFSEWIRPIIEGYANGSDVTMTGTTDERVKRKR